jgi:hypothetical protein
VNTAGPGRVCFCQQTSVAPAAADNSVFFFYLADIQRTQHEQEYKLREG